MTGVVVWITGLPAAGKTTLARLVQPRLAPALVLDSDEVRDALGMHAYDAAGRDAFYRALAELAALLARQGFAVIVAATAPARVHRERARARAPRFLEVFVDTPSAACAARDPKGLYAAAVATLPGRGAPYEPPVAPDVVAHGGLDGAAVEAIVRALTAPIRPLAG